MRVEQRVWTEAGGWGVASDVLTANAVLVFGDRDLLESTDWLPSLRRLYPSAIFFGCSTAGDILGTDVTDHSITATAIAFSSTRCVLSKQLLADHPSTSSAADALVRGLPSDKLRHVVVLSDGLAVNGTELTRGMRAALPGHVAVTGGLSADGARFERTLVVADSPPAPGVVAALGFYGSALRVGYGSLGGWDPFGPERLITRAEGNVLFELDGTNALDLYRSYLGEHARDLPAAALRFPLRLRGTNGTPGPVRTILGIDEERGSMRFAGEMPQGGYARLMKANFERLIDGAHGAAAQGIVHLGGPAELALLISCVGRRLVLGQRVDEELDSVREVVGPAPFLAGFYSYGEICPVAPHAGCELHNQTMTITTLREV